MLSPHVLFLHDPNSALSDWKAMAMENRCWVVEKVGKLKMMECSNYKDLAESALSFVIKVIC